MARALGEARAAGLTGTRLDDLRLAVHEVVRNAIDHGHLGDLAPPVDVEVVTDDGHIEVQVTDRALGGRWEPPPVRTPAADRERGRGRALAAALVDEVRIDAHDGATSVALRVARPRGGPR